MKMTIFAYGRQVFFGRKIVQMNEEVISMKWLNQDTYVSYKSINNFRSSKHANNLIKIDLKVLNETDNPMNWEYLEDTDQFIKPDGLVYSFKNYSSRTNKYGFQRDFKIYEADKIQDTPELEQLAKTDSGNQKQIHYNQTWNYFKELLTQTLHSEESSQIYAKQKIDVEPFFGSFRRAQSACQRQTNRLNRDSIHLHEHESHQIGKESSI